MSDIQHPSENNGPEQDLWAEAMQQQAATVTDTVPPQTASEDAPDTAEAQDVSLIMDVPVRLTVELGRTRMTIKDLLRLTRGSIVPLEGLAGEPLDILINSYLIAQGKWWWLTINMASGSPILSPRQNVCVV